MSSSKKRLPLHPIPTILDGLALSTEQYKYFVGFALKEKLELKRIDYSSFETRPFSLSSVMLTRLTDIADSQFGGDIKEAFAALCAAAIGMQVQAAQQREKSTKHAKVKLPFTPKSALQEKYFATASKAILDRSVVLAEGTTGIGKGRVLAAIAAIKGNSKTDNAGPVVLCAPTVATVEQLYAEMQHIPNAPTVSILPGASEFVDDLALQAYLGDDLRPELKAIREWVSAGAPALNAERPLAKAIGAKASWLLSDLYQLAENIQDFNAKSFTLSTDMDVQSAAREVLASIKQIAKTESQVIICTHAMLGIAQKNQWKSFEAPRFLIVDEAHLLESSISFINSKNVSMLSLRSYLAAERRAAGSGPQSALGLAHKSAKNMTDFLRSLKTKNERIGLESLQAQQLQEIVTQGNTLLTNLKSKSCSNLKLLPYYLNAIGMVVKRANDLLSPTFSSIATNNDSSVYVSFSKVRNFPSFLAGAANVSGALAGLWKAAEEGAVLASATLYTPTSSGDLKFDYLRTLLNTPIARTVMASPIIDPAIYSVPTLHLPTSLAAATLRPPREDREPWYKAIANTIFKKVLPDSIGGTLVLCTSYDDIHGIQTELSRCKHDRPIIAMERGQSYTWAERQYRAAYAEGLKPVFLALGVAWTGIDLSRSDLKPEDDFLLSALVITKMPVGLNNSNTMLSRINRMGFYAIEQEALLTFKQGLGRLIRRDAVTNRHLWILDGRLFDEKPWSVQQSTDDLKKKSGFNAVELRAAASRLLLNYKKIDRFN